jgi:hypothetical protein
MRKALIVLAVLLAVLAGAAFFVTQQVDLLVKVALEYYGPDITGVSVKVEDVKISAADGRGSLRGLEIGNPKGFSGARAARLGEITVAVDPATLRAPVVLVREIAIQAPVIVYERAGKSTNLDTIATNIEQYVKGSDASPDGKPAWGRGVHHRFIIDRVVIRGARVTMTNPALKGQGITFPLPDIELRDVGKRQGGVTASEAARLVTNAVIASIAQRVLGNMDLLRQGGVDGALDALKGLFK